MYIYMYIILYITETIEFFNNSDAILDFEHIAGLSRVILLITTNINNMYGKDP